MRSKQFLIRTLVLLNVVLGAVLIMGTQDASTVWAQGGRAAAGNYAVGTGRFEATVDAAWLINARSGELAVLLPDQQTGAMRVIGVRNVEDDAQ